MIRGTTPTHTFNIPFDSSLVKECRVIYAQNNEVLFTKTTKDCVLANKSVKTTLSQEDTFKFDCTKCVQIQLRILTAEGEALASVIEQVGVAKCLSDEVLE